MSPSCRVLVVEDNHEAAEALAAILSSTGAEIFTAGTGRRALELALDVKPHVIFLDIGLPDINGYDVCRRMRDAMKLDAMIIALSGWDGCEHEERVRAAGFTAQLMKPPEMRQLRQFVQTVQRSMGCEPIQSSR